MKFARPMGLMLLLPLALATQGCALFAGGPPIVATPSACSSLLPSEWLLGVAGAPLPDGGEVGDWIAFGDAQTGKLDNSNDRYRAAVGIVKRCEERDAAAVKKARRGFLGL